MQDDPPKEKPMPETESRKPVPPGDSAQGTPASANELSPEEQMARFEDALKEEDWGHQPC
jgi:hypothetical protein